MPRERGTINVDIWSDADFRALTPPAQWLYFVLLTSPKLTYCGVGDFHAGRITQIAAETTVEYVMLAAAELSYAYFAVFDQDTDEFLVRSFLRHDPVLKQPRLAVSAAKAYGGVASNKIRAVLVHELQRLRKENPDLQAWEQPSMKTVLRQPAVPVREVDVEMSMPFALDFGAVHALRSAQHLPQTLPDPQTLPTTTTATTTSTATSSSEDAAFGSASYPHPLSAPATTHGTKRSGEVA
jgi:hypothetical protein